ncbi:hypothetical protein SLE2022_331580 [Rubroshorea leprosula]
MAAEGSKRPQASSSLPPRKINVQKFAESRAAELESLYSTVANRVNSDFRSRRNKRRRTTAFDNQVAKKRFRKRQKLSNVSASKKEEKQVAVPRRIRRRQELKKNPEIGFSTSGDGTKRLRTHVWHAKRFTMTKLWGFHLPLGLHGRGRGSRALLKWFKEGVLIHDASYHVAVQLEGPEDSLMAVLQMVLTPSPPALSENASRSILSGLTYRTAMLHHVGAPHSQPIAPVTYMWRPHETDTQTDGNSHNSVECNESNQSECHLCFHRLWLWIHASAFSEGYDALKFACEKQMNERGIVINCFSREGQLAKLELVGPKAFQLLKKTFHPANSNSEDSWQLQKYSVAKGDNDSEVKSFSVPENEEDVQSCAVLSFTVKDPRSFLDKITGGVPGPASTSEIRVVESKRHATVTGISDKNEELVSIAWQEPRISYGSSNEKNLWDTSSGISPPEEEHVVCMERHQQRMDMFCLDNSKLGTLKTSNKVHCSRSCPIVILKNNNQKNLCSRWSVILPLSWVRVFWVFLVSKGARTIGQREKRWIACEIGLPHFPSDFPDCNAYLSLKEIEAAASMQNAEKRPPAVRPLRVPIPSPWNVVRTAFDKVSIRLQDNQISCVENRFDGDSFTGLSYEKRDAACSLSFDGIIARTSNRLNNFLNSIYADQLLLFPHVSNRNNSLLKFMKDESLLSKNTDEIRQISQNCKLCFLRVHLHAYKEGVFEEGAVVCAPCLNDISLWTSSSGCNEGRLKMSQSSVSSYFKEQSSGQWELQQSEDPTSRESYRWPIGFVTTGFVRGCKNLVAEAFCEAALLARLREEQWKGMQVKQRRKEIYVLVRNLRSSAYRLALATIVLEQQEYDVEFM